MSPVPSILLVESIDEHALLVKAVLAELEQMVLLCRLADVKSGIGILVQVRQIHVSSRPLTCPIEQGNAAKKRLSRARCDLRRPVSRSYSRGALQRRRYVP
jgi:hypothetical protein